MEANTDPGRKELLEGLYVKAFPLVARYINKKGGSVEDAQDIFHDALVIYMEKSYAGELNLAYSDKSYLFGIARNLWNGKHKFSEKRMLGNTVETDTDYSEASHPQLLNLLSTAGKKCMELLSAFYYEKLDMEKLSGRFGFAGARSATVQKYKCLEKVKETVKTKSLQYEDFMG